MNNAVLNFNLEQRMSQNMILSAQILQMDSKELEVYIENFAMENPLVDIETESSAAYYKMPFRQNYSDREENSEDDDFPCPEENNLSAYVMSQLRYVCSAEKDRRVIEYMADCLGENGWLEIDEVETSRIFKLSREEYDAYVSLAQMAEPPGVFARDLRECLLLQLRKTPPQSGNNGHEAEVYEHAARIIENCLDDLGKNRIGRIAEKLKISEAEACESAALIRTLNPKPGNGFFVRNDLQYIQPDVIVMNFGKALEARLNDAAYPEFVISNYYTDMLKTNCAKEIREYIGRKKKQAEWVKKCVEQRNSTLLHIANQIVRLQNCFFECTGHLRSLCMADVAGILSLHESTVSRAVKNKYLQCSKGIYPMNYFFVKHTNADGDMPDELKEVIKDIISAEDKKRPLSDQKIAAEMLNRNLRISRRTVAKYRSEMGINNTNGRKAYA